jgi:hypothetical protein
MAARQGARAEVPDESLKGPACRVAATRVMTAPPLIFLAVRTPDSP